MADNLARSGDEFTNDESSLDSILDRLTSLEDSTTDDDKTGALYKVPDLDLDADVENALDVDPSDEDLDHVELSVVDDASESPFRSAGLFGGTVPLETSNPLNTASAGDESASESSASSVKPATVVSADSLAFLTGSNTDESSASTKDESTDQEPSASTEEAVVEEIAVEAPEKIDYFADLHEGNAPTIAGVEKSKRADFVSDKKLEAVLTSEQAFRNHPEKLQATVDLDLEDRTGLLADPLDIRDTIPGHFDPEAFEELHSHGVAFPGLDSKDAASSKSTSNDQARGPVEAVKFDESGLIQVENPLEGQKAGWKAPRLTSIVFLVLLIACVAVLAVILRDPSNIDGIREGVGTISE